MTTIGSHEEDFNTESTPQMASTPQEEGGVGQKPQLVPTKPVTHRDLIEKIARETNLPEELVHNISLAYLDLALSIAAVQGKFCIQDIATISTSLQNVSKRLLNLKNQTKTKRDTKKLEVRIKLNPAITDHMTNLYFSHYAHHHNHHHNHQYNPPQSAVHAPQPEVEPLPKSVQPTSPNRVPTLADIVKRTYIQNSQTD